MSGFDAAWSAFHDAEDGEGWWSLLSNDEAEAVADLRECMDQGDEWCWEMAEVRIAHLDRQRASTLEGLLDASQRNLDKHNTSKSEVAKARREAILQEGLLGQPVKVVARYLEKQDIVASERTIARDFKILRKQKPQD